MNLNEFSQKELEEARNNGFLLGGKTGAGKSTLLNALFGKEMSKVERSSKAVTKVPVVFYYRLNNGRCVAIIDSPGLSDPKKLSDPNADNIHVDKIIKLVKEENIGMKGILFLVNFQGERFDADEIETLINYNKIFPLKRFWQHILIIFTHHYCDPNGDTLDEMKNDKDSSNKELFAEIMEKVKNVSDVINYNDLKTKYFNSYWPIKEKNKDMQISANSENRKSLEKSLDELSQKEQLYSRIEIVEQKGQTIKENNQYYIADITIIGYFDINDNNPVREEKIITNCKKTDKPIINNKLKPEISVIGGEKDPNGTLNIVKLPDNTPSYYKRKLKDIGIGGLIGGAIGTIAGGVLIFTNPVGLAGLLAYGTGAVVGGGAAGGGILGGIGGWIKSLFNK